MSNYKKSISEADFIAVWLSSDTIEEVVKITGLLKQSVQSRSSLLRSQGIELPYLRSAKKQKMDSRNKIRVHRELVKIISSDLLVEELQRRGLKRLKVGLKVGLPPLTPS